jgi:hypothetical protein
MIGRQEKYDGAEVVTETESSGHATSPALTEPTSKIPSFEPLQGPSVITEVALQLVAFRDGYYDAAGTCVMINGPLAITARHVVEDYWRSFEKDVHRRDINDGNNEGTFHLRAYQISGDGKSLAVFDVNKVFFSNCTDIAFLKLKPVLGNPIMFRTALSLLPPPVGSQIQGFGYHSARATELQGVLQISRSPVTTAGRVTEIYDERRDRSALNFPCFETNARFDGGMSGGPIFNEDGRLCGIICRNLPPDPTEPNQEHVSWVATLWPMMATTIDIEREGKAAGAQYPVLDLARDGILAATGWERVKLRYDASGKQTGVSILSDVGVRASIQGLLTPRKPYRHEPPRVPGPRTGR